MGFRLPMSGHRDQAVLKNCSGYLCFFSDQVVLGWIGRGAMSGHAFSKMTDGAAENGAFCRAKKAENAPSYGERPVLFLTRKKQA